MHAAKGCASCNASCSEGVASVDTSKLSLKPSLHSRILSAHNTLCNPSSLTAFITSSTSSTSSQDGSLYCYCTTASGFTVSLQGLISTSQYTSLSLARFTLSNLNIATLHIAGHSADSKPSASSYRSILSPRILCDSFHLSGQYPVFCSGHSRKVRTPSAASVNTLHVAKKPTD